MSKKVSKG